jgi:hypothetical protein
MKKIFLIACSTISLVWWSACDKIEGPYKEENNSTIGSLPGMLSDIQVINAAIADDDINTLTARFRLQSSTPKTISVQFEWHGSLSNEVSHEATGNEVKFENDSIYIVAPAPYGTLTFKYAATIADTLTGTADFVVPFTSSAPVRKVLLEDYTGRKCGNCPRAQRVITNTLEPLFHEQLIVATNHAGVYAVPENPPSCFSEDFRNDVTNELNTFFGLAAYPSSMINRSGYPTTHIKFYNSWQSVITQELNKPNDAYIRIYSTLNESNRTVNMVVSTEFLNDLSDETKLCVFLLEDSVTACQLDYDLTTATQIDSNYVHRHIMRAAINTTFGEKLAADPVLNTKYLRLYNYQVPAAYNLNQCYLLAYVYKTSNYNIIQSEIKKIK